MSDTDNRERDEELITEICARLKELRENYYARLHSRKWADSYRVVLSARIKLITDIELNVLHFRDT